MPPRSEQIKFFGRSRGEQALDAEGDDKSTLLQISLVTSVAILAIGPLVALQGRNSRAHHSHSRNNNDRSLLDKAHHRDLTYSRETVEDWARGPGLSPTTDVRSGNRGE